MCEICQNWARQDGKLTNHHPNCPRYNDSLIDVWKITIDASICYCLSEQDARETAGDGQDIEVKNHMEKMHREIFDALPEFQGF